jgi:hypothetical protein
VIHPVFRELPDKSQAEACSEMFDMDFKFATDQSLADRYSDAGFPPTPAYMTSVTAAYLEHQANGEVGVRAQFMGFDHKKTKPSEIAELYEGSVGFFQSNAEMLTTIGNLSEELHGGVGGAEGVKTWHINKVARAGGRLLAAHVTSRAIVDGRLIEAVAVPCGVFNDLPLLARHAISTLRPALEDVISSDTYPEDEKDLVKKAMRSFLSNDETIKSLGTISAASFLPEAKQLAAMLRAQSVTGAPSANPGTNRAERRRQQHKKK